PPQRVPPPRDELLIKVLVALRVPGVDVGDLLQVHRRYLVELMQQYTNVKAEAAEDEVGLALGGGAGLVRAGGVVGGVEPPRPRLKGPPAASPVAAPAMPSRRRRKLEVRR